MLERANDMRRAAVKWTQCDWRPISARSETSMDVVQRQASYQKRDSAASCLLAPDDMHYTSGLVHVSGDRRMVVASKHVTTTTIIPAGSGTGVADEPLPESVTPKLFFHRL